MALGCEEFYYSTDNFNLISIWSDKTQSSFEQVLQDQWENKLKKNAFRYKLNITQTKVIPGKYKFVLKLNPDRVTNRRPPEDLNSLNQKFDHAGFNFTKIKKEEILFKIDKESSKDNNQDLIIINVSPLDNYHCMLVPAINQCLTQVATFKSLCKAIEIMYLTNSPSFRIGFNSLCAFASLNHLHYHCYYLESQMLLETISVKKVHGPCYAVINYPGKGFVFQITSIHYYTDQLRNAFLLIDYFQKNDIPHNIYITRGISLDSDTQCKNTEIVDNVRDVIRIFVWARSSSAGLKRVLFDIKPAVCELFGHITVKNAEEFDSMTEDMISNMLTNLTAETFEKVYDSVVKLYETNEIS